MLHVFRNSKIANVLVGTSLVLFLATSCDRENVDAQPEIPPSSSFEMDYSEFPGNGNVAGRVETQFNFGVSALTVGTWQVFTALTMVLPVAAFKAALNQEPTYDEDMEAWHWTFTVGDTASSGAQYTCDLYGSVDTETDQVAWEMYLTSAGVFENFLWYTGLSDMDRSGGSWTVYRDPEGNSRAFLGITWERDTVAGTATLRYENIDATSSGEGGFIEAGRRDGETYDRYFTISNADNGNLTEIEWNATVKEGRYRVNNGNWNCWDASLEDIQCTN